ncbi:MAG: RNA-binding transcriptional accessory protein [Planctomycetia bacterium]|nr:RNA-binding transcriptional accessory protein [Planctomycetia bacterium]
MPATNHLDLAQVAQALRLPLAQVQAVVELLDSGNTVPFITRYRKDQTGGLDEEQIRAIQGRAIKLRQLADRKQTILRSIEAQGKATPELKALVEAADTLKRLEDLYLPYKPKKQTLATVARSRGLEPLALEVLSLDPACRDLDARAADFVNPDRQLQNIGDVLLGVGHILAEAFSERADLRGRLRVILENTGRLVSTSAEPEAKEVSPPPPQADASADTAAPEAPPAAEGKPARKGKKDKTNGKAFRDFFDYSEALGKVPPHRVLAINRGERAKILRIKVEADVEAMCAVIDELLVGADNPHADFVRGCGRDALARLILPSLEREVRRELTDRAEAHAVGVFARNLRKLLLQPPVRDCRVLAFDPGFKSGCKLAALDEFGNLLDQGVIHLVGSEERRAEAKSKVVEMMRNHALTAIAIGNGTACRETEQWVAELIAGDLAPDNVSYVIVNEAGASVYSTSHVGREEFPKYDATLRGAISIGRRLQDPLSELVKIDPANIGVGMYQHDVKAKHLRDSLDSVVESCVNFVGVDLNTASPALLRYVSGLNQLTAQRLVNHRLTQGPFTGRAQLRSVLGFGEAAFVQAAGFLKIVGGENPLDSTWIHPESYAVAGQLLDKLGYKSEDLADKTKAVELAERLASAPVAELAASVQAGALTLSDIVAQLARPGRDPRESLPKPVFKRGILKLDDLTPGMELMGTVLNVVDFGAFVDIGLKDSGLVHVSQLAAKFVEDPHDVVSVGDIVNVWVIAVDQERRRVSLTMIDPASRRASETERRPRPERRQDRPSTAAPAGRPARQAAGVASRPGRGGGPPAKQSQPHAAPRPKPKPRPLVPLTKKMVEGSEPMRTFGDLKQFFELRKQQDPEPPPS